MLAVEPDPVMRAAFRAALSTEHAEVQDRVALRAGSVGSLASVTGGEVYDAVLLLGVLMYLQASEPVIAELAAHVAPGGFLALAEGRDMRYINEIGTPARADDLDALTATAVSYGLGLENWYGVRIAIDQHELDPAPPSDPHQLAALLDVEEPLSATDPYRQLGQLAHLVLRKTDAITAGD